MLRFAKKGTSDGDMSQLFSALHVVNNLGHQPFSTVFGRQTFFWHVLNVGIVAATQQLKLNLSTKASNSSIKQYSCEGRRGCAH